VSERACNLGEETRKRKNKRAPRCRLSFMFEELNEREKRVSKRRDIVGCCLQEA